MFCCFQTFGFMYDHMLMERAGFYLPYGRCVAYTMATYGVSGFTLWPKQWKTTAYGTRKIGTCITWSARQCRAYPNGLGRKIFTNVINTCLDYQYVIGSFKMRFYQLYLHLYEKYTFSMSAILDCKLQPSCAKSRVGPDRVEISVPKLSCIPIFMLLSLIWTIKHFFSL